MTNAVNQDNKEDKWDWEALPGIKNGLKKKDGIYFPMYFRTLKVVDAIGKPRIDDTFIVGYPKSGTTWISEISWLIKYNLDLDNFKKINHLNRFGIPDLSTVEQMKSLKSPRLFHMHLLPEHSPKDFEKISKIVYVVRNPKDVSVSFYNYAKSLNIDEFTGSFNDFYNLFIQGKYWYGPWWSHIDKYASLSNVHFIHYENLIENPENEIRLLAEFLEKDLTSENIQTIIKACSFNQLKQKSESSVKTLIETKLAKEDINFYRKGEIGDWRNYFTEEMSREFDAVIAKNLKYKGIINYGIPKSK